MSNNSDGGNGNGNGGGHLKVVPVPLHTAEDKRRRACVLKLRELLAQAEQGHFLDLVVITGRTKGAFSLHWTPGLDETKYIGALEVVRSLLVDSIKKTLR